MPTRRPRPPRSRSTQAKHKHATVDMFAAQRAVDAKDYLVTEQGIDASRISVATGATDGQTVENYLVPAGATLQRRRDRDNAGGRDGGEAAGAQAAAGASPEEEGCGGEISCAAGSLRNKNPRALPR